MDKFLHNKCNVTCELKNDTTTIIAMSVSVEPAKDRKVKEKTRRKIKGWKRDCEGVAYYIEEEGKGREDSVLEALQEDENKRGEAKAQSESHCKKKKRKNEAKDTRPWVCVCMCA